MSHHKLRTCPFFVPSTEDVMMVLVFCLYLSTNDRIVIEIKWKYYCQWNKSVYDSDSV